MKKYVFIYKKNMVSVISFKENKFEWLNSLWVGYTWNLSFIFYYIKLALVAKSLKLELLESILNAFL